jgi:hypothetical protein
MDDSKVEKIITLLRELTEQNKLEWTETDSEDNFFVRLKSNSVFFNRKLNAATVNFNYFVDITNENDKKITSMVILDDNPLWNDANTLFTK